MATDPALREVLERSRALGFLGPGDVERHVDHSAAFLPSLVGVSTVLDLGSGGGVPGLVLARLLPSARVTLLDAGERRTAHLRSAVRSLGLEERVTVVSGRAEDIAHIVGFRGQFECVVARSFAPPAVTAECAVGFLEPFGRLLVSEPVDRRHRWPAGGLALVGLRETGMRAVDGATIRELTRTDTPVDHLPRAVGVPGRRPLFPHR